MKVLLLNPPFSQFIVRDNYCCHTSKGSYVWAPSDLLYVSGIIDEPDIETYVIDAIAENLSIQKVVSYISHWQPDVIIALTGTLSFVSDVKLLKKAGELTGCRIYLMGNLPAFNPEIVLRKFSFITGILHNFFDVNIVKVVRNSHYFTPGISNRDASGALQIGKINYLGRKKEFEVPVPQYHLFPNEKYTTPISYKRPMTTVITAFGCPYDCKFCVASALNLYTRSLKNLESEFDAIHSAGIREVFFMDSTFNAIPRRLREICRLMLRKKYKFSWSCNIHCINFSLEDFELMKKAGCHTIQIGVEAASESSRNEFARTKKIDNLRSVFKVAHSAGLRTLGYFIIGFPEEGKKEVLKTIDFAIELDPFFASFTTLTPDYGTAFYVEAVEKEMIQGGLQTFDNSGAPVLEKMNLTKEQRKKFLNLAYKRYYLRPKQLWKYVSDLRNIPLYLSNGVQVLRKFLS